MLAVGRLSKTGVTTLRRLFAFLKVGECNISTTMRSEIVSAPQGGPSHHSPTTYHSVYTLSNTLIRQGLHSPHGVPAGERIYPC